MKRTRRTSHRFSSEIRMVKRDKISAPNSHGFVFDPFSPLYHDFVQRSINFCFNFIYLSFSTFLSLFCPLYLSLSLSRSFFLLKSLYQTQWGSIQLRNALHCGHVDCFFVRAIAKKNQWYCLDESFNEIQTKGWRRRQEVGHTNRNKKRHLFLHKSKYTKKNKTNKDGSSIGWKGKRR